MIFKAAWFLFHVLSCCMLLRCPQMKHLDHEGLKDPDPEVSSSTPGWWVELCLGKTGQHPKEAAWITNLFFLAIPKLQALKVKQRIETASTEDVLQFRSCEASNSTRLLTTSLASFCFEMVVSTVRLALASGCIIQYVGHVCFLAGTMAERRRAKDRGSCPLIEALNLLQR